MARPPWISRVVVASLGLVCATRVIAAPVFPVGYSANARYLTDAHGTPFPILGRAAWFVLSLTPADSGTFIDDTASRGFTAIEFSLLNHDSRGNHPPFNGDGDQPFVRRLDGAAWNGSLTDSRSGAAPDFTTPNEPYWRFVDRFVARCEAKGLLVFMFPIYVGARDSDQGWMREMVANGPDRIRAYGHWIAARYSHQKNLVWMMGGDKGTGGDPFTATQTVVERALLSGIESVAGPPRLMSAEWSMESIGTDQEAFGASMSLNSAYSWLGAVKTQGRRAYGHSPPEPAFLLEEPYDEEGPDGNRVNPSATQPVRRFAWEGWLSTIAGYIAGNGYVWPFRDGTWRDRVRNIQTSLRGPDRHWPSRGPSWRDHLDTDGSRDLSRLNAFIRSIAWHSLVPSGLSGMPALTTSAGDPTREDEVGAAASTDGTLLVAYVPPGYHGPIAVNMSVMAGATRARWFDPTRGTYVVAGEQLRNAGSRSFGAPGNNSAGAADWVLVLDASDRQARATGR